MACAGGNINNKTNRVGVSQLQALYKWLSIFVICVLFGHPYQPFLPPDRISFDDDVVGDQFKKEESGLVHFGQLEPSPPPPPPPRRAAIAWGINWQKNKWPPLQ